MDNNIARKLWFFAAICFIIAGIAGKNTGFTILGCAYICIGFSKKKKTRDNDKVEK
ncbi:hypothetical protein [Terrisporobacter vanillatitrophus]|uniref:hypothetical protein n=1 Tax=Terrisporobacter vanillatitrophus TaxID=3058402 RepID=UPI003368B5E7